MRSTLRDLANQRRRFGYRRLFILLRREAEPSGVNRIHRLYREEGLSVRKRKARRRAVGTRAPIRSKQRQMPAGRWISSTISSPAADASPKPIPRMRAPVWSGDREHHIDWLSLSNGMTRRSQSADIEENLEPDQRYHRARLTTRFENGMVPDPIAGCAPSASEDVDAVEFALFSSVARSAISEEPLQSSS